MGRLLATGITFGVFMTEAIIHYNMGKAKEGGEFKLQLPPPRELAKIAAVTGAFALTSSLLIGSVQRHLGNK